MYSGTNESDQIVRLVLSGSVFFLKVSGQASVELLKFISAVASEESKASGKVRLKSLLQSGSELKVFTLQGDERFNAFKDDILLFVNNMWAAMDDKTATKGEQIWSDLAKSMMMSFCLYLYHFAPKDEQNMSTIMKIFGYIDDSETKKNDDPVDKLFKRIKNAKESSYGYYEMWSSAKGRTLSSVRATFASRMSVFNLESMQSMTFKDEMDILDLATKKVAVFMIIPDNNSVYNFMVGTLYTQMFQQLYDYADHVANGPLPRPVRFFMDEFF